MCVSRTRRRFRQQIAHHDCHHRAGKPRLGCGKYVLVIMQRHNRLAVLAHTITHVRRDPIQGHSGEPMHDPFCFNANVIGTHCLTVRRQRVDRGQ